MELITKHILLFSQIVLLTSFCFADDQMLTFKDHGAVVKKLNLAELKKISASKSHTVFEPHMNIDRAYEGFDFNDLLTKVYGDRWKKAEEILFTCSDGYQPSIPVQTFQKHKSFLSYKLSSGEEFKVINTLQGNEQVQLGPFYLTWENRNDRVIRKNGANGWPYQVTTIDLIQFKDKFPKMAPPENASAEVKRGFVVYRKHCMSCHAINGEGGGKGRDLNAPRSVLKDHSVEWLRKWITNPQALKPGTTMSAFHSEEGKQDQQIRELIAYLKEMAKTSK